MNLLNNSITLGAVNLRVKNLISMKEFYESVIGLKVLSETENSVVLGVGELPLVKLFEVEGVEFPTVDYNGLYHMAFLLPSEQDLTAFLFHASAIEFELDGAGDHGYSQALYLHDVEGNGIEIYVDRPKKAWPYLPDGSLKGITEAVNIDKLVQEYNGEPWLGMPEGSVMGHVHLQLKDIGKAKKFYQEFLGMEVQTEFPTALFISKGGYHHHLGLNSWSRNNAGVLLPTKTGLIAYEIIVSNYDAIKNALKEQSDFVFEETEEGIEIVDQHGIVTRIVKGQH